MTKTDIGFPLFLAAWNRVQKQQTPAVHLRMARWLAARWRWGDTRLLLMAFRSCGKSTIVGLFAAWLLWRNPDLRIIVLAADTTLASKMVRNTKRIIERHPLTKHLRPEKLDQWASGRFTVRREGELRDPSMLAFGIGANITGSRADVIICDDVEVPNTCDTFEKRENLRDRLSELSFVLVPGGVQLYVGTPHTYETIYDSAYLEGYKKLSIPVLTHEGGSAWPERFSLGDIERLRRTGGPRRFAAQMMLEPVPVTDSRLDADALQWYEDEIVYAEAQSKPFLTISGVRMVHCTAFWDPAFGNGGDGSAVAIVYGDAAGGYWLHRLVYIKVNQRLEEDEASQQCRMVAALCRQFFVPSLTLETNGIGRFLPAILRREARGAFAVVELSNRRPKDIRIIEALDAVLAARALHAHASIKATAFTEEMREWKPGANNRDDGLDALAGALLQSPVRIGVVPQDAAKPAVWASSHWHRAKTDFNVME